MNNDLKSPKKTGDGQIDLSFDSEDERRRDAGLAEVEEENYPTNESKNTKGPDTRVLNLQINNTTEEKSKTYKRQNSDGS